MQITCSGCGSAYALNAPLPPQGMPCPRCGAMLLPHMVAQAPAQAAYHAPNPATHPSQYPPQAAPQAYGAQPYPPGNGAPPMSAPQAAAHWNMPATPAPGYPAPAPGLNASLPPAYAAARGSWPAWAMPAIVGGSIAAVVLIGAGIAWSLGGSSEPPALVASVPAAPSAAPPSAPAPKPVSPPSSAASKPSLLDGLKSAVGFKDTHDKILSEFVAKAKELPPLFNSINDAASCEKAVKRLTSMNKELIDLTLRAARLEPLSATEHKAMLERHKTDLKAPEDSNKENMERLKAAGLITPELSGALFELVMSLRAFMQTINEGLAALPEPKNETERFYRDVVQLQRELNQTLANTKTAQEYGQLKDKVTALLTKVETLHQQQSGGSPGGPVFARAEQAYLRYRTQAGAQASTIYGMLKETYGEAPELNQQLAQFSSRCTHILDERRTFRSARGERNNSSNPGAIPGAGPGPGFGPGPQMGPGPRGGAPFNGPQQAIDQFRARAGAANTLVVQFEGETTREQSESYRNALMQLTASQGHSSVSVNNQLTLIVQYSGDVQALANQISFGKVLSVSAADRTIVVAGN